MTLPSPTVAEERWAAFAHASHQMRGVKFATCEACRVDDRPEWVKRAQSARLPVKDFTRA
jgi:hypothetical protein